MNEYLLEDRAASTFERFAQHADCEILLFGHTHKPWVKLSVSIERVAYDAQAVATEIPNVGLPRALAEHNPGSGSATANAGDSPRPALADVT